MRARATRNLPPTIASSVLACAAALASLATARSATADAACTLQAPTDGLDARWTEALRAARDRLAAAQRDTDCARVTLEVQGRGARLTYATSDGRRAVRELGGPDELSATLDALLVRDGAVGNTPPPPAATAAPPAPAPPPAADRDVPASVAPPESPREVRALFGAAAGMRAGAERLASPLLDGFAVLGTGPWELGIVGRWEQGYRELGAHVHGEPRASGFAAGVMLGRRQNASSAVGLLAGARLDLAVLDEETHLQHTEQNSQHAEARTGAYVGAVVPRDASTRLRIDLAADVVPNRIGTSAQDSTGLALLPWWAATLTLGVETDGP
jgi:hypothetical protein